MKNIKKTTALLLGLVMILAAFCSGGVFAEALFEVSGTFTTLADENRNALNPVKVTFRESGGKLYHAEISYDESGGIYTANVPCGVYDIVIEKAGYLSYTIKNLRIQNRDIALDTIETALLPGDLNSDGAIDTKDLAVMMRALCPSPVFETARQVSDFDENGNAEVFDFSYIRPITDKSQKCYDWTNIMKLQTDYRNNPIGIDYNTPEFNWVMESTKRGQKQTAYEIGVATTYEKAVAGDFDVWYSGKVSSSSSHAYYGVENGNGASEAQALLPETVYYWTVTSYDMDNYAIPSSEIAMFETALFGDFGDDNKWIESDYVYYAFDNCTIEFDMTVTGSAYGVNFGQSEDKSERYMWQVNLTEYDNAMLRCHYNLNGAWSVVNVDISSIYSDGSAMVGVPIKVKIIMDSDKITTSLDGNFVCDYAYKGENRYVGNIFEHTSGGQTGSFSNVVISDADGNVLVDEIQDVTLASALFRKQFTLDKDVSEVAKARLYSTAAGNQIMYMNGKRASDDYMAPGKSQYSSLLYYQTYDVTDLLIDGDNTVAAEVGHGWYNAGAVSAAYGTNVGLKAKLVVTYNDGTRQIVDTDSSWYGTLEGPTTTDKYYIGQYVDARRKIANWNENDSDSYKWTAVVATDTFKTSNGVTITDNFVGENMEPVRNTMIMHPSSVTNPKENVFVYKFDQNIVGTSRITAEAPEGTEISISYCEFLSGDGGKTIDPTVYNSHNGLDKYIFRGDEGGETVEFDLVYHGFQYLQIEGLSEALPFEDVEGLILTSDMDSTGVIETSNSKLNRYIENVLWSIRGNFVSTLTDCPTREKNTWTGDAQIFAAVASYYSNVYNHYRNFEQMTVSSQYADGGIPELVPTTNKPSSSSSGVNTKTPSGWSDCLIVIPWEMYNQYGDITIIKDNYDAMKLWIDFVLTKKVYSTDDGIVLEDAEIPSYIIDPNYVRLDGNYGDHLAYYNNVTGKGYYVNEARTTDWKYRETSYAEVGTAFTAYSCYILAEMAEEIGEAEDAEYYRVLHQKFSNAWKTNFVKEDGITCRSGGYTDSDGVYHDGEGSQTSYAMGLYFNMYTDEEKPLAAAKLAEIVASENYIQTVGFIGMNLLYPALGENGQFDTAMKLMENESYPSLLNMVNNGATTIWETYSGGKMSRNHYVFGAPARWLYTDVLGIAHAYKDGNEGFEHFELRPQYASYDDSSVTWTKGSFDSVKGLIKSEWKLSDDRSTFTYNCTVPANTTATLILPIENEDAYITESGIDVFEAEGIEYLKTEDGRMYFEITSGVYEFVVHNDISVNT